MSERFYNRVGADRIESRQIDELIGLARGLVADGTINQQEVEYLQKWLAVNVDTTGHPLIVSLYDRINEVLSDGTADDDERRELFDTLSGLTGGDVELGELLKPTDLPLCRPAPDLRFAGWRYTFTGTFNFGQRKACEQAVAERGAAHGSLTLKTNVLVVGSYATASWKHSSFGDKILRAATWRQDGKPIAIVSEDHWRAHL